MSNSKKRFDRVVCLRNDSKSLPFKPGRHYSIGYDHGGGNFEIYDGQGSIIIAPLVGYYLEFFPVIHSK